MGCRKIIKAKNRLVLYDIILGLFSLNFRNGPTFMAAVIISQCQLNNSKYQFEGLLRPLIMAVK